MIVWEIEIWVMALALATIAHPGLMQDVGTDAGMSDRIRVDIRRLGRDCHGTRRFGPRGLRLMLIENEAVDERELTQSWCYQRRSRSIATGRAGSVGARKMVASRSVYLCI